MLVGAEYIQLLNQIGDFEKAFNSKDRSKCGALAPPEGLYFMEVKY